jgi:hypothetical protein
MNINFFKTFKMKKTILLMTAFLSLQLMGQKKEDIQPELLKMMAATNQMDFKKVMDYTYPAIFDLAPREMLEEVMESSLENDMFKMSFIETNSIPTISDVKEIKGGHYSLVNMPTKMKMAFKTQLEENQVGQMIEGMKANMNANKIEFNKEENALIIDLVTTSIAAFDKHTENTWKFLSYQSEQREQMIMIIDEEILKGLGL